MENNSTSTPRGSSFPHLLGLAFIILKLCHVIDWSWWWVTLPLWGGFVLLFVISVAVALFDFFRNHVS